MEISRAVCVAEHGHLRRYLNLPFTFDPNLCPQDVDLAEAAGKFSGCSQGGKVDWGKVSAHLLSTRTTNQCRARWHSVVKDREDSGGESRVWTDTEDVMLVEAVTVFDGVGAGGRVDWSSVRKASRFMYCICVVTTSICVVYRLVRIWAESGLLISCECDGTSRLSRSCRQPRAQFATTWMVTGTQAM